MIRYRAGITAGRTLLVGGMIGAAALAGSAASAGAQTGGFGILPGNGGCVAQTVGGGSGSPTGACAKGAGVAGANAVAVSPDAKNVYVTAGTPGTSQAPGYGAVVSFNRNASSGTLAETGCTSSDATDGNDGALGTCAAGPGLLDADAVAVSPDGKNVYVGGFTSGSIVSFTRDASTGKLTEVGCFQEYPPYQGVCGQARVYRNADAVALSPDGTSLFVGSGRGAVSNFMLGNGSSSGTTGAQGAGSTPTTFGFNQPGPLWNPTRNFNQCIATAGVDGACTQGNATQGVSSLVVSPDGKFLYAAAPTSSAVDVFSRDPSSGLLTQTGCIKHAATVGTCQDGKLISAPSELAISPDGKNVYVADYSSGARLVTLTRDASAGTLSESGCVDRLAPPAPPDTSGSDTATSSRVGHRGRAAQSGPCTSIPGLESINSVAASPDGKSVYAAGSGAFNALTRDPSTGKLTAATCAASDDTRCSTMPALELIDGLAVSPDSANVYGTASTSSAVVVFGPGAAASGRAVLARSGRAKIRLNCPSALRSGCAGHVQLAQASSHGRAGPARVSRGMSFRLRPGRSGSYQLALAPSVRQALRRHRSVAVLALIEPDYGHGGAVGSRVTLQR